MVALQMGHSVRAGAHDAQETRWPHGRNTMLASWVIQILHSLCSFSSVFSFSSSSAIWKIKQKWILNSPTYNIQCTSNFVMLKLSSAYPVYVQGISIEKLASALY